MLFDAAASCKFFPPNLYDAETMPEFETYLFLDRISPDQSRPQRSGEWHGEAIEKDHRFAGRERIDTFRDTGARRDQWGPKTRPGLFQAIYRATIDGVPIVAFDWRRFSGDPMRLARFPYLTFVSYLPLSKNHRSLNGRCRRAANSLDPTKRGGRPAFEPSADEAERILAMVDQGASQRAIARTLRRDHKTIGELIRRLRA